MRRLEHLDAAFRHVDGRNQEPGPGIAEPGVFADDLLDLLPQNGPVIFGTAPLRPTCRPFCQVPPWRLSPGEDLLAMVEKHLPNRFSALAETQAQGDYAAYGGPVDEVKAVPDWPFRLLFELRQD